MSTIQHKAIIDDLIENHGYYHGDKSEPRAVLIVTYENAFGGEAWGVTWDYETPEMQERYLVETANVHNPKILWRMP